uniref:ShKT domain-containing protein n=1 Tax=Taenia asiatica TaxID=60517 RepID=A0A0R3WEU6_TAEAS
LFFTPNATKMFNFRAGCSARHSCPENYTQLMCTDFINGVKTCRLCCFDNNCIDPTPGSKVRVSVMKDLLLNSGFRDESIDAHLAHENEIAFNRGITTTPVTTTTTTTTTATTPAPTTTSTVDLCTSTPVSVSSIDILSEEEIEEDRYNLTTAKAKEEEKAVDLPDQRVVLAEVDVNEERDEGKRGEYPNSPADYSDARVKTTRGRLTDSQEMQMNDQTYNEEATTIVVVADLWDSSRGTVVRGGMSIASTLLITFVAAVEAVEVAV